MDHLRKPLDKKGSKTAEAKALHELLVSLTSSQRPVSVPGAMALLPRALSGLSVDLDALSAKDTDVPATIASIEALLGIISFLIPVVVIEPGSPLQAPGAKFLVAHLLSMLLKAVSETVLPPKERLQAGETLGVLVRHLPVETLKPLLPGTTSSIVKTLLLGSSGPSQSAIEAMGLKALGILVPRSLCDTQRELSNLKASSVSASSDTTDWKDLLSRTAYIADTKASSHEADNKTSASTDTWLDQSRPRITRMLEKLSIAFGNHKSERVRLALGDLAKEILAVCPLAIGTDGFCIALEILVSLSMDESTLVSNRASKALNEHGSTLPPKSQAAMAKRFSALLTALPHQLRAGVSDDAKCAHLRRLNGFLTYYQTVSLSETAEAAIRTLSLPDFQKDLVGQLDLDSDTGAKVTVVGQNTAQTTSPFIALDTLSREASSLNRQTLLRLKNAHSPVVLENLGVFFQAWTALAPDADVSTLIASLTSHLHSSSSSAGGVAGSRQNETQVLWILSQVVRGLDGHSAALTKPRKRILKRLFGELMALKLHERPTHLREIEIRESLKSAVPWDHLSVLRESALVAPVTTPISTASTDTTLTVKDFHTNILQMILMMDTLSATSYLLKKDFQPLLVDALYFLLDRIGDSNSRVSSAAWQTLVEISNNMGFSKLSQSASLNNDKVVAQVSDFLVSNMDYIINSVSHRLRLISLYPRAPRILCACLHIAGPRLIEFMDDSVLELLDVLDDYHNVNEAPVAAVFQVFEALLDVLACETQADKVAIEHGNDSPVDGSLATCDGASPEVIAFFFKNRKTEKNSTSSSVETASHEDIESFFKAIHAEKAKDVASKSPEDILAGSLPGGFDEDENAPMQKNPVAPLTKSASFASQILSRSLHFITADSASLRHSVTRVIQKGIPLLKDANDTLDPYIHTIWPSLVRRLKDREHYVSFQALDTIATIARLSPDFIFKRLSDDVIPGVISVLKHMADSITRSVAGGSVSELYTITAVSGRKSKSQKLRNYIRTLTLLCEILSPMRISRKDSALLCKGLLPLLVESAPIDLCEGVRNTLKCLLSKDHGDGVWLDIWMAIGGKRLETHIDGCHSLHASPRPHPMHNLSLDFCSSLLSHTLDRNTSTYPITGGVWSMS